jgi:hypothetical protein
MHRYGVILCIEKVQQFTSTKSNLRRAKVQICVTVAEGSTTLGETSTFYMYKDMRSSEVKLPEDEPFMVC